MIQDSTATLSKKKSNNKKMQEVSRHDMQKFLNFSYKEHLYEENYYRHFHKFKEFFRISLKTF